MRTISNGSVVLLVALLWAPSMHAQDLGKYREFQFGMSLEMAAKAVRAKPSEARTVHSRPALIQELQWEPPASLRGDGPLTDPVRQLVLSFYNDELFRVVVNYDRFRIQGLTDDDMIDGISAFYGIAGRPIGRTIIFPASQVFNESEKVIACWENDEYSFNLVRSTYQSTYGMVLLARRLDGSARTAAVEALRLDAQEAPQRERERVKAQEDEKRTSDAKARLANRGGFRP